MIEKNSRTWSAVSIWADDEIEMARKHLEAPGLDAEKTEFQRGRIAALRALLELAADKSVVRLGGASSLY